MNEDQIRQTAKELAALQLQMFPASLMDGFRGDLSLLDLAALGLTMVTGASEVLTPDRQSFKVSPTLVSVILQSRGDPAILEDYFYRLIAESGMNAEDFSDASHALRNQLKEPGIVRGLMKEAVKTLLPAQKAGRPAKLDRSDWPVLLETSERLRPLCVALTRFERVAKSRSLEDHLRYLEPDFPEAFEFLWRYLDQAKVLLSDRSFLSKVKSSKARNVRLADGLAGLQFKLTAKYAIQQAARARSAMRNQ